MKTHEGSLSRVFGSPNPTDGTDGYASGVEAFTTDPVEIALVKDTQYTLMADQDVYITFLDLRAGESSVDESTGRAMLLLADTYHTFAAGVYRNVLSMKGKTASGNLYITKMQVVREGH